MVKKITVIIVVTVIAAVFFMPEISAYSARKALRNENRDKPWAPQTAYNAGKMNLRFFRFKAAHEILEASVAAFPKAHWVPDAHFQIALCYEKRGKYNDALQWYQRFVASHPDHPWHDQANKRIVTILASR